jgi:hypothetical protein
MEKIMLDGLLFGIVDNGVLALCALWGIDLDQKFAGKGVNGALYGALIGNSLSDFIGGVMDFSLLVSFNIAVGCLIVIPVVNIYLRWNGGQR